MIRLTMKLHDGTERTQVTSAWEARAMIDLAKAKGTLNEFSMVYVSPKECRK